MSVEESQPVINETESKSKPAILMDTNCRELFEVESKDNNNNNNNKPLDRLQRIQYICQCYVEWINGAGTAALNMYDIINSKLSDSYSFQHFLLDFRFVINRRELLLLLNETDCDCNIEKCAIIGRHHRDREYYGENNAKRNKLYFVNSNIKEMGRNISSQQILDSLHSFLYHTLHIDNNAFFGEFYNKMEVDDDIEFGALCDDEYASKMIEFMENKMKKSAKRYPKMNVNDKFITMASNDNKACKCFMDNFVVQIMQSGMKQNNIIRICALLMEEQYDSESILQDLAFCDNSKKWLRCSNLRRALSDCESFLDLSSKLLIENSLSLSLYKCGYRYFYWDYYRNNEAAKSVIFGQVTGDYNVGYKLKHWYIPQKYENLKYELLNNKMQTFSAEQYNTTLIKAAEKLNAHKIVCTVNWWQPYYGIGENQEISIDIQHILALLLYTNYSKQCYEFSATFRRVDVYETDLQLNYKRRHSEYHNWGKLLRECIECFGSTMEDSKYRVFFHGIGDSLIFNSTTVRLCGPVSTTAKFEIAVNVFGRGGIVLDIKRRNVNQFYFDCPYWSDFTHEDEKLFIGGLVHFEFDTIRDLQTKQNYYNYIQPLTMFHFMIEGWPFKQNVRKWHYKVLKLLIKEEIGGKILKYFCDSVVPKYVLKLWHHFLSQIKTVEINWKYMKMSKTSKKRFGFKAFSPTFCLKRYTSLDFNIFIRLLPNVESIAIYNRRKDKFVASIVLSDIFTAHILQCIHFINNNRNRLAINALNIVCGELEEIQLYILQNQQAFYDKGWQLKRISFNSAFHHAFNVCHDTLSIQKL